MILWYYSSRCLFRSLISLSFANRHSVLEELYCYYTTYFGHMLRKSLEPHEQRLLWFLYWSKIEVRVSIEVIYFDFEFCPKNFIEILYILRFFKQNVSRHVSSLFRHFHVLKITPLGFQFFLLAANQWVTFMYAWNRTNHSRESCSAITRSVFSRDTKTLTWTGFLRPLLNKPTSKNISPKTTSELTIRNPLYWTKNQFPTEIIFSDAIYVFSKILSIPSDVAPGSILFASI